MSKLAGKTTKWLQDAEKTYLDGMPSVIDANRKRLMQIGLDAVQDELQRRAQKKTVEPSANQGQLSNTPIRDAAAKVPQEIKNEVERWADQVEREAKNPHRDQAESIQAFEVNRVVVGRAAEITVTIPVAEVKIAGEIRQLTQTEIIGLLKTYFKRVAISMAKEGQYTRSYASEMGKTVWRLFDGWNLIYKQTNESAAWPPMDDVFPGWKHAQQVHKVTADVLWRWASNREE